MTIIGVIIMKIIIHMHFFDYDSAKYISMYYLQSVKASEDHNLNDKLK